MRLTVAAIGRLKDGPERELARRYGARIDAAGRPLGIGPLAILELTESRLDTAGQRREAEAKALLAKLGARDAGLVAMEEGGRGLDSAGFARMLAERRQEGMAELVFALGGPDGHGKAIRERAMLSLSLSPMTLPHGLARVVLVEQIYRALTLLTGHPYHRA